jgi:hypothetical protein
MHSLRQSIAVDEVEQLTASLQLSMEPETPPDDIHMADELAAAADDMAGVDRGAGRPTRPKLGANLGSLAELVANRASDSHGKARLSYDARSWTGSASLLDLHLTSRFVIIPWVALTLLALASAALSHWVYTVPIPASVPVAFGGTMSLLLAFRLQISYSRWWEARNLWGATIQGSRSLLTQLLASFPPGESAVGDGGGDGGGGGSEGGARHGRHSEVAGWCIGFAVSLKQGLRGAPLPHARLLAGPRRQTRLNRGSCDQLHLIILS